MTIWQLMKNLRDKGWIPRWYNEVIHTVYDKKHKIIWLYKEWKKFLELVYKKSLRDLCAKESWLWQFVCENGMIEIWYKEWLNEEVENWETVSSIDEISMESYYYRIIEASLKNEDELEQFLLDNINIWND